MADIGSLAVRVGADITDLKKGMSDGSNTVGQFASKSGKQLRQTANQLAKVGAAATAAGAALVAGLYVKGSQAIDAQAKLARSVGSTVVSIQTLERAAELAGISQDSMGKSAAKLNQRIGEAMQGTGEAVKQFERLGISAKELEGMEADQRLAMIADRMVALNYSSSQAADALRDFGIREEKVVGLMLEGGDAFRSARKDVHDFGMAVSDVDAAQIEAANDAMTSIAATMQTVANTVAIELSPYIQEIGQRFGDASKESQGFKSEVESLINTGLQGFGKFANVLQGLRVAFKGLEVVVTGFGAVVASVIQLAAEGVTKFTDDIVRSVNFTIGALNKLPKVDIAKVDLMTDSPFMQGIRDMADTARNRVGVVRSELHELAMQELPGDKIDKFLADVAQRSQEAADAVVASRNQMVTLPENELGGGSLSESGAEKMDKDLAAIRDRFKSEQTLLQEKLTAEQELLNQALEAKRITEQEHWALEEQLLWDHQNALTGIEESAAEARKHIVEAESAAKRKAMGDALSGMSTLMNSESRKMFEIGKAAALANGAVNAYESITGAYKVGAGIGGPVLGGAYAAAAGLAQFQTLQSIRKQSFGSGTSARSATEQANSGSVPVGAGAPPQQQDQRVIRVEGIDRNSLFSGEQLIKTMEEAWKDGAGSGRLIFA